MIRFAPLVGLLLASPVVADALLGRRSVDEALVAVLIGVLAAAAGLFVLGLATRVAPPAPDADRYGDTEGDEATVHDDGARPTT